MARRLSSEIANDNGHDAATANRAAAKLARLDKERRKLLEMAYADAIPVDLLRSEQQRIAREQVAAGQARVRAEGTAELLKTPTVTPRG